MAAIRWTGDTLSLSPIFSFHLSYVFRSPAVVFPYPLTDEIVSFTPSLPLFTSRAPLNLNTGGPFDTLFLARRTSRLARGKPPIQIHGTVNG